MRKLIVVIILISVGIVPWVYSAGEPIGYINVYRPDGEIVASKTQESFVDCEFRSADGICLVPGQCKFHEIPDDGTDALSTQCEFTLRGDPDADKLALQNDGPVDCAQEGVYGIGMTAYYLSSGTELIEDQTKLQKIKDCATAQRLIDRDDNRPYDGSCHDILVSGRDTTLPGYEVRWDKSKADCLCYVETFSEEGKARNSAFADFSSENRCCGDDREPDQPDSDLRDLDTETWINDCGFLVDGSKRICGNFRTAAEVWDEIQLNPNSPYSSSNNGASTGDGEDFIPSWADFPDDEDDDVFVPQTPIDKVDNWRWFKARDADNRINLDRTLLYLGCGGFEVISLGGSWKGCGGGAAAHSFPPGRKFESQPNKPTGRGEHDYKCLIDDNDPTTEGYRGSIVECCAQSFGDPDCQMKTGMLSYPKEAAQKTPGQSIYGAPRNGGFEIARLNQEDSESPLHWTRHIEPNKNEDVKVVSSLGELDVLGNAVLSLDYRGGDDQGVFGVAAYSDIFWVPESEPMATFQYKLQDIPMGADISMEVYVYWYDDVNPDVLESSKKTLVYSSGEHSGGWKHIFKRIVDKPNVEFGRYMLIIRDVAGIGDSSATVYFDNFGIGEPQFCSVVNDQGDSDSKNDDTLWITDVDDSNKYPETCENADVEDIGIIYKFTGSKCCGDDGLEFYTDTSSGCWDGVDTLNGTLSNRRSDPKVDINREVVNDNFLFFNGEFLGCKSDYNGKFQTTNTGEEGVDPLVTEVLECNVVNTSLSNGGSTGFYCTSEGNWSDEIIGVVEGHTGNFVDNSDGLDVPAFERDTKTFAPGSATEYGCCPDDYCWSGRNCIENQSDEPWEGAVDGYRCMSDNGEVSWTEMELKLTWDGKVGYCKDKNYCVANTDNLAVPMRCVEGGQYYNDAGIAGTGDHFCLKGNWTTRTRLLAEDLVALADETVGSDKYSLVCGEYDRVLSEYDYREEVGFREDLLFYLQDKVNNMCVLRYTQNSEDVVVVGTTLNQDVDVANSEFPYTNLVDQDILLNVNNELTCRDTSPSQYVVCGGTAVQSNVYYKADTQTIIFGDRTLTLVQPTIVESFVNIFLNPIKATINLLVKRLRLWVTGTGVTGVKDLSFVTKTTDYDTIYLSVLKDDSGDKFVRGFKEKPDKAVGDEFFSVSYHNFNVDICKSVDALLDDNLRCQLVIKDDEAYYEVIGLSHSPRALDFYQALTSKLRLRNINFDDVDDPAPLAQIISPDVAVKDRYWVFDSIEVKAKDTGSVSYYWDMDTRDGVVTGERSGKFLDEGSPVLLYPERELLSGKRNITLIAVNRNGEYDTDSVEITFTSEFGCDRKLGDINGDGVINITDYHYLKGFINECKNYPDITVMATDHPHRIDCACADIKQNRYAIYDEGSDPQFSGLEPDYIPFLELCDDSCDEEIDGEKDGIKSIEHGLYDNCPYDENPDQLDWDDDKIGDLCDPCTDSDDDGFGDPGYAANTCDVDLCPKISDSNNQDMDGDGFGDGCDDDVDGDGVVDCGLDGDCSALDDNDLCTVSQIRLVTEILTDSVPGTPAGVFANYLSPIYDGCKGSICTVNWKSIQMVASANYPIDDLVLYLPFGGDFKDASNVGNVGRFYSHYDYNTQRGIPNGDLSLIPNNGGAPSFVSGLRDNEKRFMSFPKRSELEPKNITISAWIETPRRFVRQPMVMYGNPGSYTLRNGEFLLNIIKPDGTKDIEYLRAFHGITGVAHLAVTYDGQSMKMYVNGNLDASRSVVGEISYDSIPDIVGVQLNSPGDIIHADSLLIGGGWKQRDFPKLTSAGTGLDEIMIFKTALDQSQVKKLFNDSWLGRGVQFRVKSCDDPKCEYDNFSSTEDAVSGGNSLLVANEKYLQYTLSDFRPSRITSKPRDVNITLERYAINLSLRGTQDTCLNSEFLNSNGCCEQVKITSSAGLLKQDCFSGEFPVLYLNIDEIRNDGKAHASLQPQSGYWPVCYDDDVFNRDDTESALAYLNDTMHSVGQVPGVGGFFNQPIDYAFEYIISDNSVYPNLGQRASPLTSNEFVQNNLFNWVRISDFDLKGNWDPINDEGQNNFKIKSTNPKVDVRFNNSSGSYLNIESKGNYNIMAKVNDIKARPVEDYTNYVGLNSTTGLVSCNYRGECEVDEACMFTLDKQHESLFGSCNSASFDQNDLPIRVCCKPQLGVEETCFDGKLNSDESDFDCGGSCNGCGLGRDCRDEDDCVNSLHCSSGRCLDKQSCSNGIKDTDEFMVDCGGPCGNCITRNFGEDGCLADKGLSTLYVIGDRSVSGQQINSFGEYCVKPGYPIEMLRKTARPCSTQDCGDVPPCDSGEDIGITVDRVAGAGTNGQRWCIEGIQSGHIVETDCGTTCEASDYGQCSTGEVGFDLFFDRFSQLVNSNTITDHKAYRACVTV